MDARKDVRRGPAATRSHVVVYECEQPVDRRFSASFQTCPRMALGHFSLILLLSIQVAFAETLYKSVDREGRITYSSEPPHGAVRVEAVEVETGPSPEAAQRARKEAKDTQQKIDAHYQELLERRQREAEARKEAQEAAERVRIARETAERQQRIEELLEQSARERRYYGPYPYDWRSPYPWRPPRYRQWTPDQRLHGAHPKRQEGEYIRKPKANWW